MNNRRMQNDQEKMGLEQYRIADAPASLYYIPNFITPEEEQHILESVRIGPSEPDIEILMPASDSTK